MVFDGYVRVSQVAGRDANRERFHSPAVQREQLEGWAKLHGHVLGEMFEELDESGGRADRPLLMAAIERIESGESQGLVVARLDRFGRSLLHGLAAIERITAAGARVVSVQDGVDFSTDTGRLVLRVMLSMGELELDRVRSTWKMARHRAVARGVAPGNLPAGYRRGRDGRAGVDPELGPVVTEVFARRAAGESIAALASSLNERGVRTPRGGAYWRKSSVRSLFRSRAYLGELRHGEAFNPASHQPLTDPATWQAAQQPQERGAERQTNEPAFLRGIVRCTGCRRLLSSYVKRESPTHAHRIYSCLGSSDAGRCPAPAAIRDHVIEPYVEALFWQELGRTGHGAENTRLREAEAEARRCEEQLELYRDNERAASALGPERFAAGLEKRIRRHEEALLKVAGARREREHPGLPPVNEVRERWSQLGIPERRELLAELIDAAFVGRGSGSERVLAYGRGRGPRELPAVRPKRFAELHPLQPESCGPPLRLVRGRRWSEARLREELASFFDGSERWIPFVEFQQAGRALLYREVERSGGPRRWAPRLGVRYEPPRPALAKWTAERIRSELETLLRGREYWPTERELRVAGAGQVSKAITRFGGREQWAAEFGVALRPTQRRARPGWTEARIEAALAEFLHGRTHWPPRKEFTAAGLQGLYQAIGAGRERQRWARRFGVRLDPLVIGGKLRWSEDTIDAALAPLVAACDDWPTKSDFEQAGLGGLYQVVSRRYGQQAYARRYRHRSALKVT